MSHYGGDSVGVTVTGDSVERLYTYKYRYIISLFHHLHTPFPSFSPSLISLRVAVDVTHHVYCLLTFENGLTVDGVEGRGHHDMSGSAQ